MRKQIENQRPLVVPVVECCKVWCSGEARDHPGDFGLDCRADARVPLLGHSLDHADAGIRPADHKRDRGCVASTQATGCCARSREKIDEIAERLFDFFTLTEERGTQDEAQYAEWMGLCRGECQRGTPRAANDLPRSQAESVLAEVRCR